jgi:hypothetical protein
VIEALGSVRRARDCLDIAAHAEIEDETLEVLVSAEIELQDADAAIRISRDMVDIPRRRSLGNTADTLMSRALVDIHSGSVSMGRLRLEKALCLIAEAERPPQRSVDIGGDAARRHSVFARSQAQRDND